MEMKTRIFLKTTVALLYVMFMAACSPETKLISALQQQAMTDTNVNEFMQTLRDAQVGIIYHYYTSSSVMDVVIEYSEL